MESRSAPSHALHKRIIGALRASHMRFAPHGGATGSALMLELERCVEWVVGRPETEDSAALLQLLGSEAARRGAVGALGVGGREAAGAARALMQVAADALESWPSRQGWAICNEGGGRKARWLVLAGGVLYRFKDTADAVGGGAHHDALDLSAGAVLRVIGDEGYNELEERAEPPPGVRPLLRLSGSLTGTGNSGAAAGAAADWMIEPIDALHGPPAVAPPAVWAPPLPVPAFDVAPATPLA
eukprot:SAG11_NODE_877_length_6761_cov_5.177574_3_plen_242_part_00